MTFVLFVLPPVLGYFVVAVLTVVPRTHALRIALWPVVMLVALRAAVSVDMATGKPDQKFRNTLFVFSMLLIVTRTLEWTLPREPLARNIRPAKCSRSTIMDALDLATTLRGYGWDWSRGVYIPVETRPTNHGGFVVHVILSGTFHALICGLLHSAVQSFFIARLGVPSGGSIFDETLPFHVRYFRASIISTLTALAIYAAIQTYYDICTTIAVLVFGQDPAQWPPAFDAPWRATSMNDFWARRWHQFFRRMFLIQAGYPLSFVLGKTGLVIGAFLSSGVLHHIAMVSLNDQLEPWRMLVGFGMMAPVILVERAFKRATGRKVDGLVGWFWAMGWLILWGNLITDAFARAGLFQKFSFTERLVPGQETVRRLVMNFDAWVHAM